ncbi:hypothetical protein QVD99_002178 [Batrachochytrium dendrobatidis]|nr:hypothetical protein QVD99_002178 [Batrachochytrium dendrobatidis]
MRPLALFLFIFYSVISVGVLAFPMPYNDENQVYLYTRSVYGDTGATLDAMPFLQKRGIALWWEEQKLKFNKWRNDRYNRKADQSKYDLIKNQIDLNKQLEKDGLGELKVIPGSEGFPTGQMMGPMGPMGPDMGPMGPDMGPMGPGPMGPDMGPMGPDMGPMGPGPMGPDMGPMGPGPMGPDMGPMMGPGPSDLSLSSMTSMPHLKCIPRSYYMGGGPDLSMPLPGEGY